MPSARDFAVSRAIHGPGRLFLARHGFASVKVVC